MRVLRLLENRFDELSFKSKFELFVFPLVLVGLVIYLYELNFQEKHENRINDIYISKNMDKKLIDVVKDIESLAKKSDIRILNIATSNSKVELEIEASINEQINFVNILEQYNNFSNVKELKISENSFKVVLDFENFYVKNEKTKILLEDENIELNLQAIVHDKAFINESWLSINEKIGSYTLVYISNTKVILDDGLKKIELSLNEYL